MATYVLSDLHGCSKVFDRFLDGGYLGHDDRLYIIGDILDRGSDSYQIYRTIKKHDNISLLKGNHELMFQDYYEEHYISQSGDALNKLTYMANGGDSTLESIERYALENGLDENEQYRELYEYIKDLPLYKALTIKDKKYILVHAGTSGKKRIEDEDEEDLLWIRHQFFQREIPGDVTYVFGHTPALFLNPDQSLDPWFARNKIGIDGGLAMGEKRGQLNILNLDTQEVIVIKMGKKDRVYKFKNDGY